MLYDQYRTKMKKVAAFFARLYAHKVLVTVGLVVLVAIMTGLMLIKGTILYQGDDPGEVEYGDKPGYRAVFLLSIAKYEYCEAGGEDWSREAPVFPGSYRVRAVGRTLSGEEVYTEERTFTIVPRAIELQVAERSIEYGEAPSAKADLARGDVLYATVCYADDGDPNTEAWVDRESVSITTKDGEDRMFCYRIVETPRVTMRIKQRKLKITVSDASKVFDDIKLTYDAYEVSSGTLLDGDSLVATFHASITEAGSVDNTPTLRVYNSSGREVTAFYDMDIRSGRLTVEKRSLVLRSGSQSFVYNGDAHECKTYTIDDSTPLVDGHTLKVVRGTSITDVGTADNALTVAIQNRAGRDRTDSYSLFVETGTVSVTPRSVTVHTPTEELIYNGEPQSATDVVVENGVGDTVRAVSPATLTDVGKVENRMTVAFSRGGKDITGNYSITYTYGTLAVVPRRLVVQITDVTREYNGKPLTSTAVEYDLVNGYAVASGDKLTVKTDGSVTKVGSTLNRYVEGSLEILDKSGRSVLSNYTVSVEDGTLTVTSRAITVTSGARSWEYDGTVKRDHTFSVASGSLVEGQSLVAEVITECLEVGIYQNLMETSATRVYDGKEDVTDQYSITHVYGRLQITGRPITVHTESGEWVYDGKAHTIGNADAVKLDPASKLLDGHTIEFSGGASITNVGSVLNRYTAYIYNRSGEDMTHNYEITYKTGTLTVTPRTIVVSTGIRDERVYNGRSEVAGTPRMMDNSPMKLVEGHALQIGSWDTTSFIEVGSYKNVYEVVIIDQRGAVVTQNYEISYEYGELKIKHREVSLVVDETIVYTGLSYETVAAKTIDGTTLAPGHTVEALFVGGSGLGVGTYQRSVSIVFRDAQGRNVSDNYQHNCTEGKLTITPRHVSLTSVDATKVYDGTPLVAREVTVTAGSLPLGHEHTLDVEVTGEGTEVGIYPNTANFGNLRILNRYGEDVTENYVIDSTREGLLTVMYDAAITVTTGSASKIYDGLPLRQSSYTVEAVGDVPSGYIVDVQTTGVITMPGSTANSAVVTVQNAHGEDITALVEVILRTGTLTVTQGEDDSSRPLSFSTPVAGTYYLRLASYGDYNGYDWLEAVPYESYKHVACLPARVLSSLGMDTVTISFYTANRFSIIQMLYPYYVHESSSYIPATDTIGEEDSFRQGYTVETTLYDGELSWLAGYMAMPEAFRAALLGSSYTDEQQYRAFVYGQYLTLDEKTAAYMKELIAQTGLTAEDLNVVAAVAEYIRSAADYNDRYDPALDRESNVALAFLDKYREGTDRHFASAATLLYRALGIPARYVTGYRKVIDTPNERVGIEGQQYAWVEVYVDTIGWVQVDVTGSAKAEDDDRPVLELEPAFAYRVYDGTTLTAPNQLTMTTSLEALLKQGYTYSVQVLGAQTEVGVSESTIMSFTLYDAKGKDVTEQYQLHKKNGLLRVVDDNTVIVMLHQLEKTYDGKQLSYQNSLYKLISIPEGATASVYVTISMTDVGMLTLNTLNRDPQRYTSSYSVTRDGEDITDDCPLVFVLSGMDEGEADLPEDETGSVRRSDAAEPVLIIKPRAIELTAASAIRMDDGTPLSDPTVELTRGQLVSWHTLVAVAVGTCTAPGSVENRVGEVLILDAYGQDVTSCYAITCVSGTLTLVGEDDY